MRIQRKLRCGDMLRMLSGLLPGRILPSDYLEQQALVAVRKNRRRVEVLRDASRQLRTFNRA